MEYTAEEKSISKESKNIYTADTVKNLSEGFLEVYKPSLHKTKKQLDELTTKQNVLIEQLHNENLKLSWSQNSTEFQCLFDNISAYKNKLVNIKKDMKNLHERSTKLKKRVQKMQQFKEKEESVRLMQKEHQIKMEQELVKGNLPSSSSTN